MGNFWFGSSLFLVGRANFYFFMSGSNFFIPLLIPSACAIPSCLQYVSRIKLHSSSNLTCLGLDFGLVVGLPAFFSATFPPPYFVAHNYYILCSSKYQEIISIIFHSYQMENKKTPHSATPYRVNGESRNIP